jgi:hypothetical protein
MSTVVGNVDALSAVCPIAEAEQQLEMPRGAFVDKV